MHEDHVKPPTEKPLMPSTLRTSLTKRKLSRTGMLCSSASSLGSDVHPSTGRAFAIPSARGFRENSTRTFVPAVTDRRVVHEANPAEILFHQCQILDVASIGLQETRFTIQLFLKVPLASVQPVDDGVCVLGHRCGIYNERVPRGDLA